MKHLESTNRAQVRDEVLVTDDVTRFKRLKRLKVCRKTKGDHSFVETERHWREWDWSVSYEVRHAKGYVNKGSTTIYYRCEHCGKKDYYILSGDHHVNEKRGAP